MKNKITLLTVVSLTFIFSSFTNDTPYHITIKKWHENRIASLKAEEGWLNLAGLFWLDEGENTLGGNSKNKIVFPTNHSSDFIGKIILNDGKVTYINDTKEEVKIGNELAKTVELFPYKGKPIVLSHKSLRWFIIERNGKFGIRLRDLEAESLKNFKGIETFGINEKWRVKAEFIPTIGKKLTITNILGQSYEQDSPGILVFEIGGNEYSLQGTGSADRLSFVFGDATNNESTYGGGRFLTADAPDENGDIYLDFNKSYNPPCALTPFATCPLPTKENILPISILAGEKYQDHP